MAYFKQNAKTRITTDASPVGLGAILEQQQEDGTYRPVYYASRKLNSVEGRYSQFEREALAVRWACSKFYLFFFMEYHLRYLQTTSHWLLCCGEIPFLHLLG